MAMLIDNTTLVININVASFVKDTY